MENQRLRRTLRYVIPIALILLLLGLVAVALAMRHNAGQIQIRILSPATGNVLPLHQETEIISELSSTHGWRQVELRINGKLTRFDEASSDAQNNQVLHQAWIPTQPGPTLLHLTIWDRRLRHSATAEVTVLVSDYPEPTPTPGPSPTATIEPSPTPGHTPAACLPEATLVREVNYPDGSRLRASQAFTKAWVLENSGTCAWRNIRLVFISGYLLGGKSPQILPELAPSASTELRLNLLAPAIPGTFSGIWRLQTADGKLFGPNLHYSIVIPEPTATFTPTATNYPTLTPWPTYTSTPTSTLLPTPTSTPTPIPTATPTPKPSLTPTATHTSTPETTEVPEIKAPSVPGIQAARQGDTRIYGTGEPGAELILTIIDRLPEPGATILVDQSGDWSYQLPGSSSLVKGDVITAFQRNTAGDSPSAVTIVAGPDQTLAPGIEPVSEGQLFINGKGINTAEITVSFPSTDLESQTTQALNGSWQVSVPSPGLKSGDQVSAIQKLGDNESPPTSITVSPPKN